MLRPDNEVHVYLYAEPVDMRKSIDGLSILVEQELDLSPSMDALFVFCNRGRDKIKLLCWFMMGRNTNAWRSLPPREVMWSNLSPPNNA